MHLSLQPAQNPVQPNNSDMQIVVTPKKKCGILFIPTVFQKHTTHQEKKLLTAVNLKRQTKGIIRNFAPCLLKSLRKW